MTTPKVSIIIATYNASSCVEDALGSVCALHYDDWECVVVDGGSSDATLDIVRRFADSDSRIRYISEPDKGIYDAFNKGWRMAHGEYIYYLGADDTLYPDSFAISFKDSPNEDIIYGRVNYKLGSKIIISKEKYQPKRLQERNLCVHQAVVMRRDAIERMQGFKTEYIVSADFDLLQRSYLAGLSFRYVDCAIALFSINGVSSGFQTEKDCFKLRKNNHSVGTFRNICITSYDVYMRIRSKCVYAVKLLIQRLHT